MRLAALSDYPAEGKLKALGLDGLFDVVLCAQQPGVNAFKPNPRGLLRAMEAIGAATPETLYVGDRLDVDLPTAQAAGVRCVIIARGGRRGDRRAARWWPATRNSSGCCGRQRCRMGDKRRFEDFSPPRSGNTSSSARRSAASSGRRSHKRHRPRVSDRLAAAVGPAAAEPAFVPAISRQRASYAESLRSFLQFSDDFSRIATRPAAAHAAGDPYWINGWLPALDSIALYSLLALRNSGHYVEVGSGNSTKFARRAITDHQLQTQITSIDPFPRAEIDVICDRVIREPVERVALDTFDVLQPGDILFIDSRTAVS